MALFQQKGFHYFTMHQDMKLIFQMCINVLNVLLVHLTCQHSNIVWVIIIWSLTVVTLSSTLVLKLKNEHRMTIIIIIECTLGFNLSVSTTFYYIHTLCIWTTYKKSCNSFHSLLLTTLWCATNWNIVFWYLRHAAMYKSIAHQIFIRTVAVIQAVLFFATNYIFPAVIV